MSAADNAGHVEIVRVRGKGRLDPHFCWEGPNPAHDVLPLPFVCKECGFCAETRDVLDSLTFWWASTTAEPAAQAESAAPVVRLRCQGCGHFENELESVRWCKVYGDAGHSLIPVDQRGVAIVSPAPDTAHLDRLSRLYSATPTPGQSKPLKERVVALRLPHATERDVMAIVSDAFVEGVDVGCEPEEAGFESGLREVINAIAYTKRAPSSDDFDRGWNAALETIESFCNRSMPPAAAPSSSQTHLRAAALEALADVEARCDVPGCEEPRTHAREKYMFVGKPNAWCDAHKPDRTEARTEPRTFQRKAAVLLRAALKGGAT